LFDQRGPRCRILERRSVLGRVRGHRRLYGPLHGGANEAVLVMLDEIGDRKNIPAFIEKVKQGQGA
jgi:hypothetical protein